MVLHCFQASAGEAAEQLQKYSESDWPEILLWLDISGMALYLLDRIRTLHIEDSVPRAVVDRLASNLDKNRQRTSTLLQDACQVAQQFERDHVTYALLKGITLTPDSVPDASLRWQTDLDFLIDESDTYAAVRVLRGLGYRLYATSGGTMEFRSGPVGTPDIANLYRADIQKSLELHRLPRREGPSDCMTRAKARLFEGASLTALSSADILVQQALHLLKHLCGEHTRVSWVFEFWQHLCARQNDREFWREVRAIAAGEPLGDLALSISVWLVSELFVAVPSRAVEYWSPDRIPDGVLFWLKRYARELLLSDSFASKLYLLLRRQLPNKPALKDTARLMIPLCLPARITQPAPGETLAARMNRYRVEANYSWQRLRFHLFEGARYGIEALCWEWRMPKVQQR